MKDPREDKTKELRSEKVREPRANIQSEHEIGKKVSTGSLSKSKSKMQSSTDVSVQDLKLDKAKRVL